MKEKYKYGFMEPQDVKKYNKNMTIIKIAMNNNTLCFSPLNT